MDAFTVDTLQKYIKCYKRDIVLKLANEKFTDKNISTQGDLINMVLDYSPTIMYTNQFHGNINISRLRTKPQKKKNIAQSFKLSEINESKEDEENNSISKKNSSQKDENKNFSSNKDSSSISYSFKDKTIKESSTPQDSSYKKHSFDNAHLTQKKQIHIYVLSSNINIEIEFSPKETILSLKKKILNKLENEVNINLKHHLIDEYEIRPTKDMNIIFVKSKKKIGCEPDMETPSFSDNTFIKDIDKDELCFIEKPGNDRKRVYEEIISDTGESKVNITVYLKIDNNQFSKVINLDSNMCLKDVFEKISNYSCIKDKNSEYYYFVEHAEGRENEDMNKAINPDLEVKYLSPYILDLYKKKFFDVPFIKRINSYSLNLNDDRKETNSKNKEYIFNDKTAGVYQEFSVIKINSHNKRQEKILGIDLYNLKNEMPKDSGGIISRKKTKTQLRKIKDIKEIKSTGDKTFEIIANDDNLTLKTLRYEAQNTNQKNEIIAKLNYLIKKNNNN